MKRYCVANCLTKSYIDSHNDNHRVIGFGTIMRRNLDLDNKSQLSAAWSHSYDKDITFSRMWKNKLSSKPNLIGVRINFFEFSLSCPDVMMRPSEDTFAHYAAQPSRCHVKDYDEI